MNNRHFSAPTADAGFPLSLGTILLMSLALRVVFAMLVPMIDDETYAIAVSRGFSIGFFDHPPLGFWLPVASEALFGDSFQIIWRLPALILGTGVIWLFYLIGRDLGGEAAGLWTAALAAITPTVMIYGTVIVPDAPLNFFVLATLLILLRLVRNPDAPLTHWALGGAMLALAMASKYQAGLLPVSVVIWALITPAGRGWFARPGFYLAVAIALLGLVPTLLWNLGHDWASFRFHAGRPGAEFSPLHFVHMAAAQAVYLLPVMLVWALGEIFARANWADPERRLVVLIALGPIVMFNLIYLRSGGTLPHWTMPGFICLIPLVGTRLARGEYLRGWRWNLGMAGALYAVLLVAALHLTTGILTRFAATPPAWDRTAANVSTSGLRRAIESSGLTEGITLLAADGWVQGGHIAAALPDGPPMRILGDDIHHFAYLTGQSKTGPALLLNISDWQDEATRGAELLALARQYDPDAVALPSIPLDRAGQDHFRILAVSLTLR